MQDDKASKDILKVDNNNLDQSFNFFQMLIFCFRPNFSQLTFTWSKSIKETLEQGVKYAQS